MKKTERLIYKALLVAGALVLHLMERNLPVPFMTPGARLGLANLVTVLALYTLTKKREVFEIIGVRVLLSSLFGGSMTGFLYGGMGAVFSFLIMVGIKESLKEKVSIIGVSAAGAVFHHIGQLLVATVILQNSGVFLYLPILSVTGILTGVFIGLTANYTLPYIKRLPYMKRL
ncbi:heptaprenyl diphosphate synthase [Sporanaerobium hydrogeniformans]|uniref:Heptaprenyl diphosphate synthase n=1 Tax=Sporanaerobium hydrogeniformans TaxID=3072179 RepID=A0AC61D9T5_9FIRM|nr:Gx transporter family protein [Sporanaerobium hydrogeniformans]PHV69448.1 heptaprenyl diphosphate synthase [Sporanaerobium hydrogeniformans]